MRSRRGISKAMGVILATIPGGSTAWPADQAVCPVVSAGAAGGGSVRNAGQVAIGRSSNGVVTMHAGVVPCYALGATSPADPGDYDGDGDVDLDDYLFFAECLNGPGSMPNPVAPPTVAECLDAFDVDHDADVDLQDFAVFSRVFTD